MGSRDRSPLPLLGGMYTVQGVVFGFTHGILVPLLASQDVSLDDQAALVALAGLPWILKLPIAIVLDRIRPGATRVAGVSMLAMAALLLVFSMAGEGVLSLAWLPVGWFGLNLMLAAQDVCADALALDAVAPPDRGRANGIMFGGQALGSAVVGMLALGAVVVRWGVAPALAVLATMLVGGAAWALRAGVSTSVAPVHAGLGQVLRNPSTWVVGGIASLFMVADVTTSALSGAFFVQRLGWTMERVQSVLPWAVLGAQVLGYALAAGLVDRLGQVRSTALGSLALGGTTLGFAAVPWAWPSVGFIVGFTVVQGVAMAVMYVGLHAWLMGKVDPRLRATHFAVFASLVNLPRAWAPGLAPGLLAALGWSGVFVAAGLTQIVLAAAFRLTAARLPGSTSPARTSADQG